jgi:hypothetical protein
MGKAFLYIDILGFGQLVKDSSPKIEKIFEIIDGLMFTDILHSKRLSFLTLY